ncbi:MAG: 1-(5-phosphoribosyl)-5-[(5-phosphoribosylamino)methylideneamino]imidazole-4-carboxamide isomerase [Anaerolineae bacterium]|nr:1-(5-phosphoribosyl)-5-[(5-phosphoribosylamino)methylideneamino]imidazole-4-carboxamide isomerase [Anaerolineae bacterium]
MIVLPAIDLRAGRCVRLRQGRSAEETVYDADPSQAARRWVEQGATWLHVVNLDGAFAGDEETVGALPLNLQRLAEIRRAVPGTPIQFGGGVRSLAAMALALELGATRVVIGTAAVHRPELLSEAVRRFGAERVVAGIDAREGRVATHGWRQASDVTAEELGMAVRGRGVRRAVYTDISRDGMLRGVAVDETAALARATGLWVIASGGVASSDDVRRLVAHAAEGVEGVIVGQALYTGAVSLPELLRLAGTQAV